MAPLFFIIEIWILIDTSDISLSISKQDHGKTVPKPDSRDITYSIVQA